MKVLGLSGGRKNGNNDAIVKEALLGAQEEGAQIEFIHLLDLNLKACNGCNVCVDQLFQGTGVGDCVLKDDFKWLDDKILEADGLIISVPIFEKGLPGFVKSLNDRMGPSHDMAFRIINKQKRDAQGLPVNNAFFKKRCASVMAIGGSEWTTLASSGLNLLLLSSEIKIVDEHIFSWSLDTIMDDEKLKTARESGKYVAQCCKDIENAPYIGDKGVCSICHSRTFALSDSADSVECTVCGVVGKLEIGDDGKFTYSFDPAKAAIAHTTTPGKFHHAEDLGRQFGKLAQLDHKEMARRKEYYANVIPVSKP